MSFLFRLMEESNNTTGVEEDSSPNKCEMFGGFGFLIQAILGIVAFSILIVKRFVEKPRRPWKIWFYDVAKQIISSTILHLFNLLVSAIFSGDENDADACVWYFVTVFLDCTLGAFLSYIFMWLVDGIAKSSDWKVLRTGLYYEEYKKGNKKCYKLIWKKYLSQLAVWLVITLICKIILLIMLKICKRFMVNMGSFVLSPFTNGKVRLVMVMIIFPLILNALYFWCVDNILKFKADENEINQKDKFNEEHTSNNEKLEGKNQNIELNQLKEKANDQGIVKLDMDY